MCRVFERNQYRIQLVLSACLASPYACVQFVVWSMPVRMIGDQCIGCVHDYLVHLQWAVEGNVDLHVFSTVCLGGVDLAVTGSPYIAEVRPYQSQQHVDCSHSKQVGCAHRVMVIRFGPETEDT